MTHEECKDQFVEFLYKELDPAASQACTQHLNSCRECADAYAGLESTLSLMDRRQRDEPGAPFWESYWSRIEARIGAPVPKAAPVFRLQRAWLAGAAAILLVGFGIYLGRSIFTASPSPGALVEVQAPAGRDSKADSLAQRTESYLERSKVLLQGIVNQDEHAAMPGSVLRQRRISRQLIGEANVLTAALRQPDQQQVRELIADLQIILLQLANIEVEPGTPAIELVRKGVDHKSILLKIRVEELKALARRAPIGSATDTLKTRL